MNKANTTCSRLPRSYIQTRSVSTWKLIKRFSAHVCILVHMSLVFSFFPFLSFLLYVSILLLLFLFLLGLVCFLLKSSKLVARSLSHACLLTLFFFPLTFRVLSLPPALLFASSSSPLGFSPLERLSSEGNKCLITFDSAECPLFWKHETNSYA